MRILNSAQQPSLPPFLWNTSLLFSMYRKYFPHDLVPSLVWRNKLLALVLSDQFPIQSAQCFILAFLKLPKVYTFWLISKRRNIFTISRNSICAPASSNFSTIARCPSKHALCRAVRLYCQDRDSKGEMHIKMCINPF